MNVRKSNFVTFFCPQLLTSLLVPSVNLGSASTNCMGRASTRKLTIMTDKDAMPI